MDFPTGIHASAVIRRASGTTRLELALGPADSLGNLEDVLERFVHAYCLSVGAESFAIEQMRMCLFDPQSFLVAFDEDDAGGPDQDDAMSTRFAFAFVGQMEEESSLLDPWLVVRPCVKTEVQAWYELM
ncbi:MAG: hypothetical protein ACOCXJ_06175, partial [Planctomycetota bacterium]